MLALYWPSPQKPAHEDAPGREGGREVKPKRMPHQHVYKFSGYRVVADVRICADKSCASVLIEMDQDYLAYIAAIRQEKKP